MVADADLTLHEESKHTYSRRFFTGRTAERGPLPPIHKAYAAPEIPLPREWDPARIVLEEAIQKRRSRRDYAAQPLSLPVISRLLYYANGITGCRSAYDLDNYPLRAAPSAGGLAPIELYLVANHTQGLERGLYYYNPPRHSLHALKSGDFRAQIAQLCLDQDFLTEASVVFWLTAVYPRTRWKYGTRAYRYVHLDAGHVSQNLLLEAVSLELGACCIGAFFDDALNDFLGVDGQQEFAVLGVAVGPELVEHLSDSAVGT